jgi:putative hemolysin
VPLTRKTPPQPGEPNPAPVESLSSHRSATVQPSSVAQDSATALPIGDALANFSLTSGAYRARFAQTREDLQATFRLRFLVFNLELHEGLESAYADGYDTDAFDAVCSHLIVEHSPSNQVVGTYRLQTGQHAAKNLGYYSAREFDLAPFEPLRDALLEVGRASIHRDHRSFEVLTLLWRGLAHVAASRKLRYLMGCSSLTSQDPAEGSAMYAGLQKYLVEPAFRTVPREGFSFPISPEVAVREIKIAEAQEPEADTSEAKNPEVQVKMAEASSEIYVPRLLRAYLSIGARICGPPAIDREFKTIDFLTLLDLDQMPRVVRSRFIE